MTTADLPAFTLTFHDLVGAFARRLSEAQEADLLAVYFRALTRYTLPQVQAGAEAVTRTSTRWPKPAEWIAAMPRAATVAAVPTMPDAQAAEHRAAKSANYQRDPCGCAACVRARISHQPQRFLPDLPERRFLLGDDVVLAGHWAHGDELARWYVASAAFWALKAATGAPGWTSTSHRTAATLARLRTQGPVATAMADAFVHGAQRARETQGRWRARNPFPPLQTGRGKGKTAADLHARSRRQRGETDDV